MKLERLPEYLLSVVVTILGLVLALYAGSLIGSGNTKNLMLIAGAVIFVAIGLIFKERIWILMFLFWPAEGRLLGTPASPHDGVILLAFAWFLIFKAFKLIRNKPVYGLADIILIVNLLYITSMYIRNPVGGLAMSSDIIGVRPYISITLAAMAYWVLNRADLSHTLASRLPYLSVIGHLPTFFASLICTFVPGATGPIAKIYAGIDTPNNPLEDPASGGGDNDKSRYGFLRGTGAWAFSILGCLFRPLTLINPIYFGRFFAFSLAALAILLTGFRSSFILAGMIFFIICWYRRKISELFRIGIMFTPVLVLMIMMQGAILSLPFAVQRSLSFLPGNWDQEIVENAEGSSEWRLQMWRVFLNSGNKYLKNWWLGDGFGYSMDTLRDNLAAKGDHENIQEGFIITGRLHNGPLSTIRNAGYVGLALYYLLMFSILRLAHRLIVQSRNTPYFIPMLFFGAPTIAFPFFFTIIFGAYELDFATSIYSLGVLKLLERAFNRYREEQRNKARQAVELPALLDERPQLLSR